RAERALPKRLGELAGARRLMAVDAQHHIVLLETQLMAAPIWNDVDDLRLQALRDLVLGGDLAIDRSQHDIERGTRIRARAARTVAADNDERLAALLADA